MDALAEKLMKEHKHPIVKLNIKAKKIFRSGECTVSINEILERLKEAINTNRVDRRCARSKLNWLPERKQAQAISIVGNVISHYGFEDKSGRYFYPEEVMFLLETNKIEIFWNNVPLSIQKAFEVLIRNDTCDFKKYRIYKKLCLEGFKVARTSLLNESEFLTPKKCKKTESNEDLSEIFKQLQEKGPKIDTTSNEGNEEFYIYKKEKSIPTYKIHYIESSFNSNIGFCAPNNLFCFADKNDLSFLTCRMIDLPTML